MESIKTPQFIKDLKEKTTKHSKQIIEQLENHFTSLEQFSHSFQEFFNNNQAETQDLNTLSDLAKEFQTIFTKLERGETTIESTFSLQNTHVVLIPGVFNGLFRLAHYEKAFNTLSESYNLSFSTIRASGTAPATFNKNILKEEFNRIKKMTSKKLWVICFSKGGVDFLHFASENSKFCDENLFGVTMLASPLMGNASVDRFEVRQAIKLINKFEVNQHFPLAFMPEVAASYREEWFKQNREKLPKKCFYSTLSFESSFNDSHAWIILMKLLMRHKESNDGVVDIQSAKFPANFNSIDLGIVKGDHSAGSEHSSFNQELLIQALLHTFYKAGMIN